MVKFKNTPRKHTLANKLDHRTFGLVKNYLPAFLAKTKKEQRGQLPAGIDLAREYVEYLGEREKAFSGIDVEALTYKMTGFKQLYDHLRKRTNQHEEEKPATPIPLPKTPDAPRQKPPSPPRAKHTKEKEPPVAVTATGHYEGHQEEKDVPMRHNMDSYKEESDPDVGDQGFEEED